MQIAKLVSTVIMALVLMVGCDPPVITETAADTAAAAAPPVIPSADPALRAASVEAAKAVQISVNALKRDLDTAQAVYTANVGFAAMNAPVGTRPALAKLSDVKTSLLLIQLFLSDLETLGLIKRSERAVAAAKAVVVASPASANAPAAVRAAEAVKTAINKTDDPSVHFQISAAVNEVDDNTALANDDARTADVDAIAAAQTQVDELKKLADEAVAAAEAIK